MRSSTVFTFKNINKSANCKVLLLVFLILPSLISAQKINFSLNADRTDVMIGEHVRIFIEASADRKTTLLWPLFPDTLSDGLRVLRVGAVDSTKTPDGIIYYNMQLTVTAYDSGTYCLDNIRIRYSLEGRDIGGDIKADSIILRFSLMETDEGASLRDIKGILKLPFSLMDLIPWLLIFAIIALIVVLVLRFLRKHKKKPIDNERVNVSTRKKQPWEIALNELEALRKSDLLWVTGVKAYYTSLSDIIRVYIRDGLGTNAPEFTTRETLQSLKGHISVSPEQKEKLARILFLSDMVKFAKYNPLEEENKKAMDLAINFVTVTAPDHLNTKNEEEAL